MEDFVIFSGTSNPALASAVAEALGIRLGRCCIERFPDSELSARLDETVRGREVFLLQSTSAPVNEHLMELLALADACRRASAESITAMLPYFGYARADKRSRRRESIMASVVAEVLEAVGVNRVVMVDVHTPQIEGFFRIPVDNLTAVPLLCAAVKPRLSPGTLVVSPDAGRVPMATQYAERLNTSVVVLHKRRESGTQTRVTHLVGEVRGRPCLIVDDMISTGGTMAESINALCEAGGGPQFIIAATHGLFVGDARSKLDQAHVQQVFVTDTVSIQDQDWPPLVQVSIAPLIASAIRGLMADGSLSGLC